MYCNANKIIEILQNRLELDYDLLIKSINDANIYLKERDIKNFLDRKFFEENPEAKKELDQLNYNLSTGIKECIESGSKRYELYLNFRKYQFEPYTLEYFENYIGVLKNKCNNIIRIIDGIIDKTLPKYILEDLDISLNDNGCILKNDINRLVEPLIYNYKELMEMVVKANDLKTYLNFKMSLDNVYKSGSSEDELYPLEELQNSLFEINGEDGYIPYTKKQKKLIRKKENDIIKLMCDDFKNLK